MMRTSAIGMVSIVCGPARNVATLCRQFDPSWPCRQVATVSSSCLRNLVVIWSPPCPCFVPTYVIVPSSQQDSRFRDFQQPVCHTLCHWFFLNVIKKWSKEVYVIVTVPNLQRRQYDTRCATGIVKKMSKKVGQKKTM